MWELSIRVVGNAVEKFYLDLGSILQSFHHSGELIGEIPAKKLGNKVPWKAHLRVVDGNIISCFIIDNRGATLHSSDEAIKMLYKVGTLTWEIILESLENTGKTTTGKTPAAQPPRSSGPLPGFPMEKAVPPAFPDPEPVRVRVPYRLMNISLQQMNQTQWPREYRLVYILIDGERSSEKIASMLAMSPQAVQEILLELKKMLLLDFRP